MTSINIKIFGPDFEYESVTIEHGKVLGTIIAFAPLCSEYPAIPPSQIFMEMIAHTLFKDPVQPGGPDRETIAFRVACATLAKLHADGAALDEIAQLRHILAYARTPGFRLATYMSEMPDCDAAYEQKLAEVRARFEAGTLYTAAPPGETIQ
jgi:hypothetical protein